MRQDDALTIERFYSEGLSTNKVLGLICTNNHITCPPRKSCMICQELDLKITELKGSGKIISFTEVYSKSREFPVSPPYFLALVKLDEGPNLLGVARSMNPSPSVGSRVRVRFEKIDKENESVRWPRISFYPEDDS